MPLDFRSRLTAARETLGLSRADMAKRLLTPRHTYNQWESGARRTPGAAVVAAECLTAATGASAIPKSERNAEIARKLIAGGTYSSVAAEYSLSKERVRQIADNLGVTSDEIVKRGLNQREREAKPRKKRRNIADAIGPELERRVRAGEQIYRAAAALGLSPGVTRRLSKKLDLGALTQHGRGRRRQ